VHAPSLLSLVVVTVNVVAAADAGSARSSNALSSAALRDPIPSTPLAINRP
jgi:hypothetical protein